MVMNGAVDFSQDMWLEEHVESITVVDLADKSSYPFWEVQPVIHVFKLTTEGPMDENAGLDAEIATCQQTQLPSRQLHGLWDSLIFDANVKSNVLEYATTAMLFTDRRVNPNIIAWNRVVLFHGPPGTGKSSLCKALSQKLSIRLSDRFPHAHLLEINAHSLFSKWFSESGKLVTKLFQYIQELVDDPDALVCVLIDEIESLTATRQAALAGSEPSDAIRVVNAVLTQLDLLKVRENVIILTTSNLTQAIDVAFVDRADIKMFIGLPSAEARFNILKSCTIELMRVGIIQPPTKLLSFAEAEKDEAQDSISRQLFCIAGAAQGLSGRALRKIPFQTHAFWIKQPATSVKHFLEGMQYSIEQELNTRNKF